MADCIEFDDDRVRLTDAEVRDMLKRISGSSIVTDLTFKQVRNYSK